MYNVPHTVNFKIGTAVRVCSPCPRLYIVVVLLKTCNCPRWDTKLGPLTPLSGTLPLDHCDT